MTVLTLTASGLYCPAGDFYIDPWQPIGRAIVTHAHADHARPGHQAYLTTPDGRGVLQTRLGTEARIQTHPYRQPLRIGGATVRLFPAGHILGSAQVSVTVGGETWVVSGDYKTEADATCLPFEAVPCHTFITESTFGLPIYHWRPQQDVFAEINAWWRSCQSDGTCAVLYGYSLGKAQRLLAGVDATIGPIYVHGAVHTLNHAYAAAGIALPACQYLQEANPSKADLKRALVVAPPSAGGSTWLRRLGTVSQAFASGWMQLRGTRRRRALDRGFVLSDHIDWPSLLGTVQATGAQRVLVTHGYTDAVVRYLRAQGVDAAVLQTEFGQAEEA